MKRVSLLILCLLFVLFLTGCVKTYTYQVEREDQVLTGNRGVIMGEVPEPGLDRKPTRTMLGIDVELASSEEYKTRKRELEEELEREEPFAGEREKIAGEAVVRVEPKKASKGFADEQWVRPPVETEGKKIKSQATVKLGFPEKYTIQKGDTLEKISKKFLGKASRWPEIYEENKDIITSPSKIYPGQVIILPQTVAEEEEYK